MVDKDRSVRGTARAPPLEPRPLKRARSSQNRDVQYVSESDAAVDTSTSGGMVESPPQRTEEDLEPDVADVRICVYVVPMKVDRTLIGHGLDI